jgi:hypothetical protein
VHKHEQSEDRLVSLLSLYAVEIGNVGKGEMSDLISKVRRECDAYIERVDSLGSFGKELRP